jgi:cellulase/cellobiase CelA1
MEHGTNLFAAHRFYIGHALQRRVHSSMGARWAQDGKTRAHLAKVVDAPSAFWVDRLAKITGNGTTLASLLADAESQYSLSLVAVIMYDLPNRDCHALASNGELCCEHQLDGSCNYLTVDASCQHGLQRCLCTTRSASGCATTVDSCVDSRVPDRHYVDQFAGVLASHASVPVVVVIEPDSLPNLATNLNEPRCGNGATRAAYSQG